MKKFIAAVRATHGESVARSCERLISEASPTESLSPMRILAQAISASEVVRDVNIDQFHDVIFNSSFKSKYHNDAHHPTSGHHNE